MVRPFVDFSKLRVLVVENHALMRRLLREMLRGFGVADIQEAKNVPGAIDLIYTEHFDVVILDFFLGDMDGADFAWVVRKDENCINRQVPILLITGMPQHHRVLKVRDAGINGMLAKPIAPKDLYQRIYMMLAYPRPFIITPDYVGPQRDRKKPENVSRPTAARLMRGPMPQQRRPRCEIDPANEDQILI
jgi:CheY-like chemotaxis protein